MIERDDPARIPVLKALHERGGRAMVVGVTGPPGAGKSTLADKVVGLLRARGAKVAVLAVDPSSPFTGGAILGDRIRMQRHALDDGVFIRSLATRGHLGGLSASVSEAVRVLDSAGYDYVIVETVGVGQSEIDVVRVADTVVLVSVPGLGDDIQAIKAGVMEIGDIFCVNKADKDGAERVAREIRSMLETAVQNGAETRFSELYAAADSLGLASAPTGDDGGDSGKASAAESRHHGPSPASEPSDPASAARAMPVRVPPVIATIGETGIGVDRLVEEIARHGELLSATGLLAERRKANLAWELGRAAADRVAARLDRDRELVGSLSERVLAREIDFYDALDAIESDLARIAAKMPTWR